VAQGLAPQPRKLEFYVRRADDSLGLITAQLCSSGSLVPLFVAFGLISEEEAVETEGYDRSGSDGRDLFEWLGHVAGDAAAAGEQHDALKRSIRSARTTLEEIYGFASITLGGEFSVGGTTQLQHLDALAALMDGLSMLRKAPPDNFDIDTAFQGLNVYLYHPDAAPMVTVGFKDADGTFNVRSEPMASHIADSGTLHVVADSDPEQIANALAQTDLYRARLLGRVNGLWTRRSRDLAAALKARLGVENVWFDSRGEYAARRFVIWAGNVLERMESIVSMLRKNNFAFSVLVHSDTTSPLLEFVGSSSVLQVRTDCPPKHLLAFMASEAGALAHQAAAMVADGRAGEEAALAAVRDALGAKAVVRVCSTYDQARVMEAAQRLLSAAPSIRASIDLTGVSLAIDDCYDVWDSGFISIPYDFSIADLKPKLVALLTAPGKQSEGSVGNGSTITAAGMAKRPSHTWRGRMLPLPARRTLLNGRPQRGRLTALRPLSNYFRFHSSNYI
jgi:hypothetical protein